MLNYTRCLIALSACCAALGAAPSRLPAQQTPADSAAAQPKPRLRGPLDGPASPFLAGTVAPRDSTVVVIRHPVATGLRRGSKEKGAFIGAIVGAGVGLTVMLLLAQPGWCVVHVGPGQVVAGTLGMAALGAGTGAMIGSAPGGVIE